MQDRTPFTYHVFWTALNKGYIGCRYGKSCHPSSLGATYFSSNPEVQALWKTQAPDVVEITEYSTPEEAFNAENQLIRSVALNDPRYFNQTCGFGVILKGYVRTDKIRAKNSASNKGRNHSEETRAKMSAAAYKQAVPLAEQEQYGVVVL